MILSLPTEILESILCQAVSSHEARDVYLLAACELTCRDFKDSCNPAWNQLAETDRDITSRECKRLLAKKLARRCGECGGQSLGRFVANICWNCCSQADITKTTAIHELCISSSEFETMASNIGFERFRNPHYRNAAPMITVNARKAFLWADNFHSTKGGVEKTKSARLLKAKQRAQNKLKLDEKRKNELVTELSQRNIELRSDSSLCASFINGSKKLTACQVADIMHEMNWLFNNTRYKEILNTSLAEIKEENRFFRKTMWDELRHDASERAKNVCVYEFIACNQIESIKQLESVPMPVLFRQRCENQMK